MAAACRDATDRYARMWKADGDDRPIGQLRTWSPPTSCSAWDTSRPPVTAHITIHAPLPSSARRPGGTRHPSGAGVATTASNGAAPSAATRHSAHLRELLRRWADAASTVCTLPTAVLSTSRSPIPGPVKLRAVVTEPSSRRAARTPSAASTPIDPAGCGSGCAAIDRPPPTTAYRPTAAQRRFVAARDRGCRHPGCSRPAIWTDLDHVTAHDRGGATDCANLCTLCRRHHRLKTHARAGGSP